MSLEAVRALIARLNTTFGLYEQHIFTHEDAERSDFVDLLDTLTAVDALTIDAQDAVRIGWGGPFDGIKHIFDGTNSTAVAPAVAEVTGSSRKRERLYYRVEQIGTGVIIYGRLTSAGDLDPLPLTPDAYYRIDYFSAVSRLVGRVYVRSAAVGLNVRFPPTILHSSNYPDSDHDGLPDDAEIVLGTSPVDSDTDQDGVDDGAELDNGTDPLDGRPVQTGIIASVDTPGTALDVCETGGLVLVADGSAGVEVFNAFSGLSPTMVASIDTPGTAEAIACGPTGLAAVVDGSAGLAILDVSNPAQAVIKTQVSAEDLLGTPRAVVVDGTLAYVGTTSGYVVGVDLLGGLIFDAVKLGGTVSGLAIEGRTLVAIANNELFTLPIEYTALVISGQISVTGNSVFVGGGTAFVVSPTGYSTVDVSSPANPVIIKTGASGDGNWMDLAVNTKAPPATGIAYGVATSGAERDVTLWNVSNLSSVTAFLTRFTTPGNSAGLALSNGLAYVADGTAGLQVVNYLAFDTSGVAPTVSFKVNSGANSLEEASRARVTVAANDDVQVRSVDFLADGKLVATDGSFPFDFVYTVPSRSQQTSVQLTVRATDTGGNQTTATAMTFSITPDLSPPAVIDTVPRSGFIGFDVEAIVIRFSEPIDPAALSLSGFSLINLGPDGVIGGGDDVSVPLDHITLVGSERVFVYPVASMRALLQEGVFVMTVDQSVIGDAAGNHLIAPYTLTFGNAPADPPGTVRWVNLNGGEWHNAANWSTGSVPTSADSVVVDVPGAPVMVTVRQAAEVKNLSARENLALVDDGYLVVTGMGAIDGTLDLTSGTRTGLQVYGPTASVVVNGQMSVSGGSIDVYDNATLSLPTLVAASDASFSVDRAVLLTPALQIFTDGSVAAEHGASLSFPSLTNADNLQLGAWWDGSISLPSLTSYTRTEPEKSLFITGRSTVAVALGGTVAIPQLQSMVANGQVINITLGRFAAGGGTISMPLLTSVTTPSNGSIHIASSDSWIDVSSLRSIPSGMTVEFQGAGGDGLEAPLLTSVAGALTLDGYDPEPDLHLSRKGRQPNLGMIDEISGYFEARLLDFSLPGVSSLSGATLQVTDGSLSLPSLSRATDATLGADSGTISAPNLVEFTGGHLLASQWSTVSLPVLSDFDDSTIRLSYMSTLTLGGLESYELTESGLGMEFEVSGPGATLNLPALDTISSVGQRLEFTISYGGGTIDLGALTIVNSVSGGTAAFNATGAGALIDLSGLASFDPTKVSFTVTDGGEILLPPGP